MKASSAGDLETEGADRHLIAILSLQRAQIARSAAAKRRTRKPSETPRDGP